MKPVESITKSLAREFDKLNQIRENSLRLSREIIRACSKSIRNVHRNELKDAKTFLKEAERKNTKLKNSLKNSPELRFAGYIVEAEKELVEASLVYEYELNGEILPYKVMDVSASSYIQGIGDAIGEWRRKALDHLRKLDIETGEKYLKVMESGMDILNELDYPDALTGGLRRYADNARALIERTRSDITNAVVNDSLRRDLSKIDK